MEEGQNLKCHKVVLATHSKVISDIVTDSECSCDITITLIEVSVQSVQFVLDYLYARAHLENEDLKMHNVIDLVDYFDVLQMLQIQDYRFEGSAVDAVIHTIDPLKDITMKETQIPEYYEYGAELGLAKEWIQEQETPQASSVG